MARVDRHAELVGRMFGLTERAQATSRRLRHLTKIAAREGWVSEPLLAGVVANFRTQAEEAEKLRRELEDDQLLPPRQVEEG